MWKTPPAVGIQREHEGLQEAYLNSPLPDVSRQQDENRPAGER